MKAKAFNMIDTSLALGLALVGMSGLFGLLKATADAEGRAGRTRVAWQLLDHARTQSSEQLQAHNERYFDGLGRPTEQPETFFLRVTVYSRIGELVLHVAVFWDDEQGLERRLFFERKEWAAHE